MTFVAIERYLLAPDDIDPIVPENAIRHAGVLPPTPRIGVYALIRKVSEPIFVEENLTITACGRWARICLHERFDPQDSRSCLDCIEALCL